MDALAGAKRRIARIREMLSLLDQGPSGRSEGTVRTMRAAVISLARQVRHEARGMRREA